MALTASVEIELPPQDWRLKPETWPADKHEALKRIGMEAVALVGYEGPTSYTKYAPDGEIVARMGHNRAIWPFSLARTASWKDTVSQNLAKGAFPDLEARAMYRLWCLSDMHRDLYADAIAAYMKAEADIHGGPYDLKKGWFDLGPNLHLDTFVGELHELARRQGIQVFDDAECSRFIDKVMRLAREILNGPKSPRRWEDVIDIAVERAMRG